MKKVVGGEGRRGDVGSCAVHDEDPTTGELGTNKEGGGNGVGKRVGKLTPEAAGFNYKFR